MKARPGHTYGAVHAATAGFSGCPVYLAEVRTESAAFIECGQSFFHILTLGDKYIILTDMSISSFFRKLFGKSVAENIETTTPEPEPRKPEERFILCIDGGGMRGIIPVVLLQNLERAIRANGGKADLASYFDLVSGTSTGGLISLALTCESTILHKSLEDGSNQINLTALLDNYMTMGDKIFQANTSIFGLRQIVSDKYTSEGIRSLSQRWFGTAIIGSAKVPTLIMAYDLANGQPQMIRSYADERDYPVWVAARATSAAPTFFSPCEYAGKLLVDGGVVANNPAIYAYFEARKLYPQCTRFHILSFSTGGSYHTMDKDSTKGLMNWADQISPMFDTAQKRTAEYVLQNLPDVDYVRIDNPLSRPVKMDETNPSTLRFIKHEAENNALMYDNTLDSFAKLLIQNMENR